MDFRNYKHHIVEMIDFYRGELDNPTGGWLHIVLDDGNTDHGHIVGCLNDCENNKDSFGYFLGSVLLEFSEEQLEKMYDSGWEWSPT